jgi:hypothetical protein
MTEPNAMRARAGALNLHGVLAHWGEVGDQAWLAELPNLTKSNSEPVSRIFRLTDESLVESMGFHEF